MRKNIKVIPIQLLDMIVGKYIDRCINKIDFRLDLKSQEESKENVTNE